MAFGALVDEDGSDVFVEGYFLFRIGGVNSEDGSKACEVNPFELKTERLRHELRKCLYAAKWLSDNQLYSIFLLNLAKTHLRYEGY